MIAPKPVARKRLVNLWRYLRLFRQDILSAQPAHLYRAWMAEFRTPFFRSYLCNDPALIERVLKQSPGDFPKSDRIRAGLAPLLGRSVFVTNGEEWARQRRIIDPAFAGRGVRSQFHAMKAAAEASAGRLASGGVIEMEKAMSHAAADVIFRTLFSIPIEHQTAHAVFHAFRDYQRSQPLINLGAFLPLARWFPRLHRRGTRRAARQIRHLISELVRERAAQIRAGLAPDDLATRIMTFPDPATGRTFSPAEMADQVAIFFLAGHETSAAALAWALYLLAADPAAQERAAAEARVLPENITLSEISRLTFITDVFREALRLYAPVPMMVRESRCPVTFRGRTIRPGAQIVLSLWHLHRHERLWSDPDGFDPDRWQRDEGRASAHRAFLPFSAGPRVCPGAGFAMIEGPLVLATLLRTLRFDVLPGRTPVPVAHLTVRARDGIWLAVSPR
jgi:cytochrome P450